MQILLPLTLLTLVNADKGNLVLSADLEGLVYSPTINGVVVNVVMETGATRSFLLKEALPADGESELSNLLKHSLPTRMPLVEFTKSVSKKFHFRFAHNVAVIGMGARSKPGQKPFALMPLGQGKVQYIDKPVEGKLERSCRGNKFHAIEPVVINLKNFGSWSFVGEVSVEGVGLRIVQMHIQTGLAGVELPGNLYQAFVFALHERGMKLTPAKGEFKGFSYVSECKRGLLPSISYISEDEVTISTIRGDEYSIPLASGGCIVGVKEASHDFAIRVGSLFARTAGMMFDAENERLLMCNVQ